MPLVCLIFLSSLRLIFSQITATLPMVFFTKYRPRRIPSSTFVSILVSKIGYSKVPHIVSYPNKNDICIYMQTLLVVITPPIHQQSLTQKFPTCPPILNSHAQPDHLSKGENCTTCYPKSWLQTILKLVIKLNICLK